MTLKSIASVLALSVLSVSASANALNDGHYRGEGLWNSTKASGSYRVSTVIQGPSIESIYDFGDGQILEWKFKMVPKDKGFFAVETAGMTVGHGYCLENWQVCHYEVQYKSLKLEETLTHLDGQLYRLGSKDEGDGRVVWQETYDRTDESPTKAE